VVGVQPSLNQNTDSTTQPPPPAQVTHVINLGIVGSHADYVHRAGRVGRIGQRERGAVVSVLLPSEVAQLEELGGALQFTPRLVEMAEPAPLAERLVGEGAAAGDAFVAASGEQERYAPESAARAREDIFSLYAGEGIAAGGNPPADPPPPGA
jgi:superfamily II DNA/RNA helicase